MEQPGQVQSTSAGRFNSSMVLSRVPGVLLILIPILSRFTDCGSHAKANARFASLFQFMLSASPSPSATERMKAP